MTADDLRGSYLSVRPILSPSTLRAAAITVAEHGESRDDVRDLLVVLGLIDATPIDVADLPAQACGHPRSSLRRRQNGLRGIECVDCKNAAQRVRDARARSRRVTSS